MNKYDDSSSEESGNSSLYLNMTDSLNSTESYSSLNLTTTTLTPSGLSDGEVCPVVKRAANMNPEFSWDKKLQGLILGAFFWGYTVMQIPSGYLSDVFGPRLMISIGMFPVALLSIICPFLARGSPYLLLVGRVLIGCGQVSSRVEKTPLKSIEQEMALLGPGKYPLIAMSYYTLHYSI